MSKLLVAVDIDGTIADAGWRNILAGKEPNKRNWKKYKKWLRKVQSKKMLLKDKPVSGMRELVISLKKDAVYITARNEIYRKVTKKWLKKNGFPNLPLHMRKNSDRDTSGEYKEKVILKLLHKRKIFHHVIVIDDDIRNCVESACKRNSWTFLKAKSGS